MPRRLASSPLPRSLLYEMALFSGLRANELRSLTIDDLDLDRYGVILNAEWTKNRQEGCQPLYEFDILRMIVPGTCARKYLFSHAPYPLIYTYLENILISLHAASNYIHW